MTSRAKRAIKKSERKSTIARAILRRKIARIQVNSAREAS